MAAHRPHDSMLLVANYDSDVGFAWWLMESFWVALSEHFSQEMNVLLAYPSISKLPAAVAQAPLEPVIADFSDCSVRAVINQCRFIFSRSVRSLYLTDAPSYSWRYALFRLAGVRHIVVHDHTPGRRTIPGSVTLTVKRLLHSIRFFAADAMIGATPFVTHRHHVVLGFPANRCYTAANGLPPAPAAWPIDVHEHFSIPENRRILVSVARAHRVKGIQTILCAMEELVHRQHREDLHFLYCGDGPELDELKRCASDLSLNGWVTFAGKVRNIPSILRGCDVAIHASTSEVGYSLAILEFMQAGLPLIVSDDPSVCGATIDGVNGLYFNGDDYRSAARAISRLIDEPAFANQLAERAQHDVESHYRLQTTHEQLLNAFESILRSSRVNRPSGIGADADG